MFPMVASKKLSPLPDAGKSNLSAGDSVVKTSPFDSNLAEPFITAAILAEIGAAVGEISNASTVKSTCDSAGDAGLIVNGNTLPTLVGINLGTLVEL